MRIPREAENSWCFLKNWTASGSSACIASPTNCRTQNGGNTNSSGCYKRVSVSRHFRAILSQICYLYSLTFNCTTFASLPPLYLNPPNLIPDLHFYSPEHTFHLQWLQCSSHSMPTKGVPVFLYCDNCIIKVMLSMATNSTSLKVMSRGNHLYQGCWHQKTAFW